MNNTAPKHVLASHAPAPLQSQVGELTKPAVSLWFRALVALLCFGFALAPRLVSFRTSAPMADELHWVNRSDILRARIASGNYDIATTHLGHPGIPAATMMALGQSFGEWLNTTTGAEPFTPKYMDALSSSRLGNVVTSSIVFPVIVLGAESMLGLLLSAFAALLLALECQHIGLSKIAHIDGTLTLLVTASMLLYFSAERSGSVVKKLVAGMLWGLSIATKPTAAALIGVLLIYKTLRAMVVSKYSEKPIASIGWAELWAVIVGHIVLGTIYTKLWDPNNTYITKHHIQPHLSELIADFSARVLAHPPLDVLLFVPLVGLAATLLLTREPRSSARFHLLMASFTALFLALACIELPIVTGNLVRFWYWVAGLSARKHEAYGMVWAKPGLGYPEIWARRLPSMVLFGFVSGAVFLFWRERRSLFSLERAERFCFLAALFAMPFIWTLPLNVSSKQTTRYLLPAYPAVILFCAWGLCQLAEAVAANKTLRRARPSLRSSGVVSAVLLITLLAQGFTAYSWRRNPNNFYNLVTGGPSIAFDRGFVMHPTGYDDALRYVQREAERLQDIQYLEVLGDYDLMKFAFTRMMPKSKRRLISIRTFKGSLGSDWLLEFPAFSRQKDIDLSDTSVFHPELTLEDHGVRLFTLYRISARTFAQPQKIVLNDGARKMGRMLRFDDAEDYISVDQSFAGAGYIHFDQYIRVMPGTYRIRAPLLTTPGETAPPGVVPAPETKVIRLELSSECTRVIPLSSLSLGEVHDAVLDCTFTKETRAQFSIYWYGDVAVQVHYPTIERLN
ncbi:MAG: hypothetical protein U0136_01685 [Bdellovibrionota bacterium]